MAITGVCVFMMQVLDVTEVHSAPTVRNAAPDPVFVHTSLPSYIWKTKQVHSSVI